MLDASVSPSLPTFLSVDTRRCVYLATIIVVLGEF